MSPHKFTMHLTSEDSINAYPENKPWSFYVIPPYTLNFYGEWVCSVQGVFCEVETHFEKPLCFHVLLDCVSPSIAYGRQVRICATTSLPAPTSNTRIIESSPIAREGPRVEAEKVHRIKVDLVKNSLLQHCTDIKKAVVVLQFIPK